MKYLIAGLGNIGPEYEVTRHNIGFLVLDRLADLQKTSFDQDRHAFVSEVKYKGRSLHLIKPTTYMNLSGKAVSYWMNQLKIDRKNLLVITDDVSLPFGKLRLKPKGSSGGHNGLKNIEETLGGQDFTRLKFGIGDDYPRGRQVDYVLSPFSKKEFETLAMEIDRCIEVIYSFCTIGIERTMNQYN